MTHIAPISNQCLSAQMGVIRADLLEKCTIMCTGRCKEKIPVNPGFTGENMHFIPDKITTKDSIESLVGNYHIPVRSMTGLGVMLSDDAESWYWDGINQEGFLVRNHQGSHDLCTMNDSTP